MLFDSRPERESLKRWYTDLQRGEQVLHIYQDHQEQARVIQDLLAWMDEGERAVLMSDRWQEGHRPFRSAPIESAIEEGRLEVQPCRASLYPTEIYHPEVLVDLIEVFYQEALDDGCTGLVVVCDLTWLCQTPPDLDKQVVNQSRLVLSSIPRNLTILTQFHARECSAKQVDDLSRVYQLVLRGGDLVRNFYMVSTSALGGRPRSFAKVAKGAAGQSEQYR